MLILGIKMHKPEKRQAIQTIGFLVVSLTLIYGITYAVTGSLSPTFVLLTCLGFSSGALGQLFGINVTKGWRHMIVYILFAVICASVLVLLDF